MRQKRQIGVN